MVDVRLFQSASFGMGNLAGLMSSMGRGGLQFMLIIWLQGIWLPLHGYSFESTPLWAGIYLLPITVGFLVAGPIAGSLSDRFGARPFTVGGMLLMAATFIALVLIPVNFNYWVFALLVFLNGLGGGIFTAPNTAAIMSSVPAAAARRGVRRAGDVLQRGLVAVDRRLLLADDRRPGPHAAVGDEHRPAGAGRFAHPSRTTSPTCRPSAACSPRSSATTRWPNCSAPSGALQPPGVNADVLTGKTFFPQLITEPFHSGLTVVFIAAAVMMLLGRIASLFNPGRYGDAPGADNAA